MNSITFGLLTVEGEVDQNVQKLKSDPLIIMYQVTVSQGVMFIDFDFNHRPRTKTELSEFVRELFKNGAIKAIITDADQRAGEMGTGEKNIIITDEGDEGIVKTYFHNLTRGHEEEIYTEEVPLSTWSDKDILYIYDESDPKSVSLTISAFTDLSIEDFITCCVETLTGVVALMSE